MGCIMVITLLSFPRREYASQAVEAARFWFALLVTWLMFYLAVLTGFMAFLFSGLATYNQLHVILLPAVPGMLTMLVAFICFCHRFATISPGGRAVRSWFIALVLGADVKTPDDDEGVVGQLVGYDAFWNKLQRTLGAPPGGGGAPSPGLPGTSSSATPQPSAADPTQHGLPHMSASGPGNAAGQQPAGASSSQPAAAQPQRSSSKQSGQLQQLGGPGSSSVIRRRATGGGAASSSGAGASGGINSGGGDSGGSGGGGSSNSRSASPLDAGAPAGDRDQGSPLQQVIVSGSAGMGGPQADPPTSRTWCAIA